MREKELRRLLSFWDALERRKRLADEISKIKNLLQEKKKAKKVFDVETMDVLKKDMMSLSESIESEKEKREYLFETLGWEVRDDSFPDEIYVDFQITYVLMFGGSINIGRDVVGGFEKTIKLPKIQEKIKLLNKKYKTQFIIGCEARRR